jgi:hypothetical protein
LDVVQMRCFLDWSLTGAFGFSHLYLHHHWSSGQGGLIESHFRFEKYCDPGDSWMYLLNKYKIKLGWEFIFLISLGEICILNTFNYFLLKKNKNIIFFSDWMKNLANIYIFFSLFILIFLNIK